MFVEESWKFIFFRKIKKEERKFKERKFKERKLAKDEKYEEEEEASVIWYSIKKTFWKICAGEMLFDYD